jgi:hypothetical protein
MTNKLKLIKVKSFVIEPDDLKYQPLNKRMIDEWKISEEYKFLQKHCEKIHWERIPNPERLETVLSFHAYMNEKTEIFWRLKYR